MTEDPRITVVMTTYNSVDFVHSAIASVLSQSCPSFELLVVDDCSQDATVNLIEAFAAADARVRVIRNKRNLGPYSSANLAIAQARGELIARLDSDDIAAPDRLARQLAFMDSHLDHILVGGGYRSIDGSGAQRYVRPNPMRDEVARWISRFRMPMVHPSICFRKTYPDGSPVLYDETFPISGDFALINSLLLKGRIATLDGVVVDYRMHAQNISTRKLDTQRKAGARVATTALARHYPPSIIEDLKHLVNALYRQAPRELEELQAAARGLEMAMRYDMPNPPSWMRRRAAGILAEAFWEKGSGLPRILAHRPISWLIPLMRRSLEIKGVLQGNDYR